MIYDIIKSAVSRFISYSELFSLITFQHLCMSDHRYTIYIHVVYLEVRQGSSFFFSDKHVQRYYPIFFIAKTKKYLKRQEKSNRPEFINIQKDVVFHLCLFNSLSITEINRNQSKYM